MTNAAELDKKFGELEARFAEFEKTLGKSDPRKEKARGLVPRVREWQRDLDRLYLVWDRWNTDRKLLGENEDASRLPDALVRARRQQQLELQLDVDVPSLHVFGESLLDHVAQTLGYLFQDEDLRDHDLLCKREILPRPLQERAVGLREEIGNYWRAAAQRRAAGTADRATENDGDLTALLQGLQTYAYGMGAFLDAAIRHPALKLKKPGLFDNGTGRRRGLWWAAGLALLVLIVLVGMSWTCVPASLSDVMDDADMYPPLPAGCQLTVDGPSEETSQKLESRREQRGLDFQRRVTCKLPKRSAGAASLDNFYLDRSLQHGRQVFLAETQVSPDGGTLVVVESTLIPRWKYLKRLAGQCEAEIVGS